MCPRPVKLFHAAVAEVHGCNPPIGRDDLERPLELDVVSSNLKDGVYLNRSPLPLRDRLVFELDHEVRWIGGRGSVWWM